LGPRELAVELKAYVLDDEALFRPFEPGPTQVVLAARMQWCFCKSLDKREKAYGFFPSQGKHLSAALLLAGLFP
jgi:hypothetical protein